MMVTPPLKAGLVSGPLGLELANESGGRTKAPGVISVPQPLFTLLVILPDS
jgi:hypothetical protein